MPAELKKGSIELIALLILQEGDAHGYQLVQLIKERSEGLITVQEGSFYPLLYRMEKDGYIEGRSVTVETPKGRTRSRVVYHLLPAGRERLRSIKAEYDKLQRGIRNVLANCTPIVSKEEQSEQTEERISAHNPAGNPVVRGRKKEVPGPA